MPGRDLLERVRKALGDRYTVLAAVGRGGNASIFAGRDPTGAQVAIKVLHPELAVSVAADRFLREIRYASQLNHPHIARLIDSGEADYLLWYVMPYVPGDNLRQVLRRGARLSVPDVVRVAAEVLDAHQHRPAPDVRSIRRDVPKGLAAVLARALVKPRAERWQRAGDMRVALAPFVGAE